VVKDLCGELPAVLVRGDRSELDIERLTVVGLALRDEIALRELVGDDELGERLVVRSERHVRTRVHRRDAGSTVELG